jgi:hypothetical protein
MKTASRERAVSQVVGFVLLFSLIVATAAIAYVAGFQGLTDTRDAERLQNAERAFELVGDDVQALQQGAPQRRIRLPIAGGQVYVGEQVQLRVSLNDTDTSGANPTNRTREFTYAPIVYAASGTQISYAQGAVIREQRNGQLVHRGPPFVFRDDRAVLPLVGTTASGDQSLGGTDNAVVRLSRTNTTVLETPNTTAGYDTVWVNISSPRAQSWQQYFNRTAGVSCEPLASGSANCSASGLEEIYLTRTDVRVDISSPS